jgi:hypothetical protein
LTGTVVLVRSCGLYVKKGTRRVTSCSVNFLYRSVNKVGTEELMAIIAAMLILLIYLRGDK